MVAVNAQLLQGMARLCKRILSDFALCIGGEAYMISDSTSKYISLILRHKPETIDITLDEHGWANVDELIEGVSKTHPLTMEMLEEIVATDNKQRYSFNDDRTLIRANQGHSIPVDVELEEVEPPKYLYHGTAEKYVASIEEQGLISKSRLYVHLSPDHETAVNVGTRHGKPVVYRIKAQKMFRDGCKFYKSVNGVWLTNEVPVKYFTRENFDEKLVTAIESELINTFKDEDYQDIVEEQIIPKYGWDYIQQALFRILLNDSYGKDNWEACSNVIYGAVLDKRKIKKKTTIALLYYRLGDVEDPYENNTVWSITSSLYHLDYCNSEYNALKDDKIIEKLKRYGFEL